MSAVSAVRATKYHEINWFSAEGILLCPLKPLVTFSICSRSVQLWHLNFPGWLSPTHALSTLVSIGDPWGKGLEVDKWWDFASSCQPNFPQPTEMGVDECWVSWPNRIYLHPCIVHLSGAWCYQVGAENLARPSGCSGSRAVHFAHKQQKTLSLCWSLFFKMAQMLFWCKQ